MATEINPNYVRFVRQVSNGMARAKYSYLAMQRDLLAALKTAPWTRATCAANAVTTVVNKVSETDSVVDAETGETTSTPSYTAYIDDKYDAFKQGGDADTSTDTFCGYAGMVAYRFELPSKALYSGGGFDSITMRLTASRYLRSGVRVVCVPSDDATPSEDWSVVRGEGDGAIVTASTASTSTGVSTWGAGAASDASYLLASQAREIELSFTPDEFSALSSDTEYSYLWVYVSIEDYTDYWTLYNSSTTRYYSIEGSAQLIGSSVAVTFTNDVTTAAKTWSLESLTSPFDMILPYTEYGSKASGTMTDTDVANSGNFVQWTMDSGMLLMRDCRDETYTYDRASFVPSVLRFADFPRMNMFNFAGIQSIAGTESNIERLPNISDIGVFAGVRNGYVSSDGTSTYEYTMKANSSVGFQIGGYANMASIFSGDKVSYVGFLKFYSLAIVVNTGSAGWNYRYMRYVTTPSSSFDGVELVVNVWRTRSPDALGLYGGAILSALCSHQEMFIGTTGAVSASITGDGASTSEITLTAAAKLVGSFPVENSTSEQTIIVALTDTVTPGDVIVFCPRIVSVDGSTCSATPSALVTPTSVKFSE